MKKKNVYPVIYKILWRFVRIFVSTFLVTFGTSLKSVGYNDSTLLASITLAALTGALGASGKALRAYIKTDLVRLLPW